MTAPRRGRGESGASLVLALAFITLVSVSVAGVLSLAGSSFQTARVTRERVDERYAADGGVEIGVRALRDDYAQCAATSATAASLGTFTIDGRSVAITCQTLAGTSISVPGTPGTPGTPGNNALTVTDAATAVTVGSGTATDTINVAGPMFSAAAFTMSSSPKFAVAGTLSQRDPACTADQVTFAAKLTATPWTCVPAGTVGPDPNPSVVVPGGSQPATKTNGASCVILYPGKYTSRPTFVTGTNYYLASGTYYFHNLNTVTLQGKVFGGAPGTNTQAIGGVTPCATDAIARTKDATYTPAGSGVTIVLGGSSILQVSNNAANRVELFTRVPGGADAAATPGVGVWARASGTGVSNYSGSSQTTPLITAGPSSNVVIHGNVSLPDGGAKLAPLLNAAAAAGQRAQLAGGAVLARLEITSSTGADGAVIAAGTGGTPGTPGTPATPATERRILVTATAAPLGTGAPTVLRATITLPATQGGAPTVLSWRLV